MNKHQIAAIETALTRANGKRRERLADLSDVASVVQRVAKGPDGQGLRRICGTVPNSYKYRASATVVVAARVGDVVRLRIIDGSAAKVSGGGSGVQEGMKSGDVAQLLSVDMNAPRDPLSSATSWIGYVIEIPVSSAKRWPQ